MAIRKVIESDLSGKVGAATVTFGLKDTWFEIDLTEDEQRELEKSLERYAAKARKATGKGEKKKLVPDTTPEEREAIREWGRSQGMEVPPFGRIPKKVQAAYDQAHNITRNK